MKMYSGKIKSLIQKYPKLYYSISYLRLFIKIYWKTIPRTIRHFINKIRKTSYIPTVLQLPITYKCNFDCIMCGMKNVLSKQDFTPEELSIIIDDKLFSSIKSVGVNGGEPFIKENINDYISVLSDKLPSLENIYIITNGYFTEKITQQLLKIKKTCEKNQIKVNLSISIDGVHEIQDTMRGKVGAFQNAVSTYTEINSNLAIYCDNLNVICTITKLNIEYINEIDVWAKENKANIIYNIATIHKRIYNSDRYEDFSIFTDEKTRYLTAEFLYSKFVELKSERYYALFKYVINNLRISPCQYHSTGVTLTPNGQLSYCATYSNEIGNAIDNSAEVIFNSNLKHLEDIKQNQCGKCSHYIETLSLSGYYSMCHELFKTSMLPIRYYW